MTWTYKGEQFQSVSIDWDDVYQNSSLCLSDWVQQMFKDKAAYTQNTQQESLVLLYVPKWNKCYTYERFGVFGNGNQTKFLLKDIYSGALYYTLAKDVELVVKAL